MCSCEFSGVAAEAAELSGWMDGACYFCNCSSFVLSYSGLGLLSLQSLWGPSTETVGGFCGCGTFLFRTQSTHSSLLRTKYWWFFCFLWSFQIQDSVYSLTARGPSTKFLTLLKDFLLKQLLYLYPRTALVDTTESTSEEIKFLQFPLFRSAAIIHHVLWTSLCSDTRIQFAVPLARIDPIYPPDLECTCWGPCQLWSWVWRWIWVQEWPLTQSSSASAMLYSHTTSPACRIRVTLDTVYNCQCYAFICWDGSEIEGLLQAVFLEIPPNFIRGEEYSSPPDQLHALCGDANLYSSTVICIRLNSSKINSSNNNVAACAAPFIPLYSL